MTNNSCLFITAIAMFLATTVAKKVIFQKPSKFYKYVEGTGLEPYEIREEDAERVHSVNVRGFAALPVENP